jgi:hypothetical protein
VTIGGNGPVIEAGFGADVAVFSLLAALVMTSFTTAGAAFGLPAVFLIGLLRAAGAVFFTVLT